MGERLKMKKKIVTIVDPKVDDLCALFAHITARAMSAERKPPNTALPPNDSTSSDPPSSPTSSQS
jgi:hypothetical protein